jgi:hypothetical protein
VFLPCSKGGRRRPWGGVRSVTAAAAPALLDWRWKKPAG